MGSLTMDNAYSVFVCTVAWISIMFMEREITAATQLWFIDHAEAVKRVGRVAKYVAALLIIIAMNTLKSIPH